MTLLCILLYALGIPTLIYAIICLWIELSLYLRSKWYAKQGMLHLHFPFKGWLKFLSDTGDPNNQLKLLYDSMKECKKQGYPALTVNNNIMGCSDVMLLDLALIKEFFLKENEVCIRESNADLKIDFGFIVEAGEKGLAHRRIFIEFFKITNLDRMAPTIWEIVDSHFRSIKSKRPDGSLDIKSEQKFIEELIIRIVNTLLFGDHAEIPRVSNGNSFSEETLGVLGAAFTKETTFHPLNQLLFNYPHKYNLLAGSKEIVRRAKELKEAVINHIKARESKAGSKDAQNSLNVIDMMIEWNRKSDEKDRLTYDEMVGDCYLFLVAGYDSTSTAVKSMIYNLGLRPDVRKTLKEDMEKTIGRPEGATVTFDTMEKSNLLDRIVRESIRANPPAGVLFPRRILKNFKIGKYQILKGDTISCPIGPLMWDTDYFPAGKTFDVNAITEENKKWCMPFSVGVRNCIGQNLAQLEIKIICMYILQRYELETTSQDMKYIFGFTTRVEGAHFKLTPLK